jgi:hypothetical protein
VDRVLATAAHLIQAPDRFNHPKILTNGGVAVWREKITFTTGHRLEVMDCYSRLQRGMETRNFKYQFMDSDAGLLFRFDTHGKSLPLCEPCHLHVAAGQIFEGDPRLGQLSLVAMDFLRAFHLAHTYLDGGSFPWE